jgi:hypothetical protein
MMTITPMQNMRFSGTFIIRTDYNVGRDQLRQMANPDYIEGYDYKKTGLFENSQPFLVIRNWSIDKDKRVLDWMQSQGIAKWSSYVPVTVSEEDALAAVKRFA